MKLFTVLSALALVTLSACGSSQESSVAGVPNIRTSVSAELTELALDPQLSIGDNYGASVVVDQLRKNVFLQISTCPADAMCIWAGPSYSADLQSVETNNCGDVTYIARKDNRPVDGALIEITVHDFSKSTCRIHHKFLTVVELSTTYFTRTETEVVTTHSELKGLLGLQ